MDAVSFVSSIVGIVDVVSRSLLVLYDVHKQLKQANLTIAHLIAELKTIQRVLDRLQEWVEENTSLSGQPYQLTLDLDASLQSCHLLVIHFEKKISKLKYIKAGTHVTFLSKIAVVLNDKETKDYLGRLNRQITALNLCIAVANLPTSDRQVVQLNQRDNREIFDRIRDDASSLEVLYDSASFRSACTSTTTSSSRYSSVLPDLDARLLSTGVYQKSIRGLMRRANVRKYLRPGSLISSSSSGASRYSDASSDYQSVLDAPYQNTADTATIEQIRTWDTTRPWHANLILGDLDGSINFIRACQIFRGGHTIEERLLYRCAIFYTLLKSLQELLDAWDEDGKGWKDPSLESSIKTIREASVEDLSSIFPDGLVQSISCLWSTLKYEDCLERFMTNLTIHPEAFYYFLGRIECLAEFDYLPTESDIARVRTARRGSLTETRVAIGRQNYNFVLDRKQSEQGYLKSSFANVTGIVFVVDLSGYNKQVHDWTLKTRLTQDLINYKTAVNSQGFGGRSILVVFTNLTRFEEQLEEEPFAHHFPEYFGGDGVDGALGYLINYFNKASASASSKVRLCFMTGEDDHSMFQAASVALNGVRSIHEYP